MARPLAFVLSCEHATAAVPPGVDLGVPEAVRISHVGWDRLAAGAARGLRDRLGGPLHLAEVSRLVVDLNRSESDPQVIPAVSFGMPVPGNATLSPAARAERLDRWWRPFRARVRADVAAVVAAGKRCVHLSVHSFTPTLDPRRRTYPLGLLYDPARALECAVVGVVLEALRGIGLDVRENEPYLGTDDGHTTGLRGDFAADRYAGIEVEVNDALPPTDADAVLGALADALDQVRSSAR